MFHEETFFAWLTLERRLSPHTLSAYQNDLSSFLTYLTDKQCLTSIIGVRHSHIRAWTVALMQSGESARTVNRRLSCLKTYFKFLLKRGVLTTDPMKKVVGPKTGKRLPVFVQESQMTALLTHVPFAADYGGQLARTVIELLYATGMRRSELSTLEISDIDFSRSVFRVRGKGNKTRLAPFAPYLANIIQDFLAIRTETFPESREKRLLLNRKGEPLSPQSIYYIVHKFLSLVSTEEQRSPHVLRHSFATHLSNQGAELNAIKALLGHSSLAATQIYMHNSIERLKKVYEKAHPKGEESEE